MTVRPGVWKKKQIWRKNEAKLDSYNMYISKITEFSWLEYELIRRVSSIGV